jgi:type II secretory ATPase GspE/PulE/Tfp pilus assembly ATPase PilB-like protein
MDTSGIDTAASEPKQPVTSSRPPLASFLEHLVKSGVVTKQQALEAAEWKRRNDKDKRGLAEILEEEFAVPRDPIRQAIAQYYAFRTMTLLERSVRKLLPSDVNKILRSLPEATFQQLMRFKLLPFDLAENQTDKIILVTPNPADREIHELARVFPFKWFEICYMKEADWAEYLRALTSGKDKEPVEPFTAATSEETDGDFEAMLDREIARAKVAVQLDNVFLDALRSYASEIHFLPSASRKTDVFFRLDGHLSLWHTIEEVRCEAVSAALKELAVGVDRYERQGAQQGMIQRTVENVLLRFTVSVLPVLSRDVGLRYESIVLRVFREADSLPRLDQLALDPHSSRVLQSALTALRGLILFTGSGRSGALTLQIAALRSMLKKPLNAVIVQEYTHYIIDGARQVKLNPRLTADDALRMIADQDPDLVVLGDLNTRSVAEIAIRMANIGHLVLAMLPSRTASKALGSLVDTTGARFAVAEAVTVVIAQQSIRLLCERCKKEVPPAAMAEEGLRLRDQNVPPVLFRNVGCIGCKSGYGNKRVLFETLAMTPAVRRIVLEADRIPDESALETAAMQDGMITMRQQAHDLLHRGHTTVDEFLPFIL